TPWFSSFALSFLFAEVALQRSEDHVTKITTLLQGADLRPPPKLPRHIQRRLHLALRLPIHHQEYSLSGFWDLLPAYAHADEPLDPPRAVADLTGREAHDERQVRMATEPIAGRAELGRGLLDCEELIRTRAVRRCHLDQACGKGALQGAQTRLLS